MKLSLNWIKDYVDVDFSKISIKELNDKITLSIAEVEEIIECGTDVRDVVVGKIVSITSHPHSNKLSIVKVDIGDDIVQSVCGANNIFEGMIVPFAKSGGAIKNHPKIVPTVVDGIESCGVLCSAAEIGVSDDHTGVLSLDNLCKIGQNIKSVLPIEDIIIDIDNKSLTNRPDLWGHYGFAREIAAVFGGKLKSLPEYSFDSNSCKNNINVNVIDTEKCNRYSAVRISNIQVVETNWEMKIRLYYCGVRSISLLVDLTNYVMLDLGQPLHAFDGRYMDEIIVKTPESPICFKTLDGIERNIDTNTLMIYNSEKPVAIAGIMGGEESEITDSSNSIFLESANFSSFFIRRSAINLGLRTEASTRYEKSLDTGLTLQSIKRFIYLLHKYQSDILLDDVITDIVIHENKEIQLSLEKEYIDRYIGLSIPTEKILHILNSLGFNVTESNGVFNIVVPSFRTSKDITSKVDIIEEITRIYGYDNIVPQPLSIELKPLEQNEERIIEHQVKECLASKFGLSEVQSYVWYDNAFNKNYSIENVGNIKVKNPQTIDSDTLRDSIIPSLLQIFEKNSKNFDEIGIFEIGHIFTKPNVGLVDEKKELGIIIASKKLSTETLYLRLKGIADYLARLLKRISLTYSDIEYGKAWIDDTIANLIKYNGMPCGYITSLNPQIKRHFDNKWNFAILSVDFSEFVMIHKKGTQYSIPSKYPEILIDFNFLVDVDIRFCDVDKHIKSFTHPYLLGYEFIEVYSGKQIQQGKKCMTFSFKIGSKFMTLTNENKEEFSSAIINHMNNKGYILRQ